jgi:N-acetylneuraminate synthase/sialic acid synthase
VVRDLERTRVALGDGIKRPYESETSPLNKMVKRVVAARALTKGHAIAADDVAFRIPTSAKITPSTLRPFEAEKLMGRALIRDIGFEEPITHADVGIG